MNSNPNEQTGHELASMQHRAKGIQRDIVDMFYDDRLSNKEALQLKRQAREKAYREELARVFREAIEALPPMPDKFCDWCGIDLASVNDHYRIIDAQLMCQNCVQQYNME